MAQKLFVGNLNYSVTSDQLQQLFAQAGNVISCQVLTDRMTGRSRGFGFVEMSTDEESQKAVDQFNGYEMDGRKLVVNVARPREDRPQQGGYDRRDRGGYNRS